MGHHCRKYGSHSIPISVWPVVMYGYESCTLRKNEERRLEAFEMKRTEKDSACFVDSKENK